MTEIDDLIRQYNEFEDGDILKYMAALDIVSALKQNYHPFLWSLVESTDAATVVLGCSALAVSLRGVATKQDFEKMDYHLCEIDPLFTHCSKDERDMYKLQMLNGMTSAEVLRSRRK